MSVNESDLPHIFPRPGRPMDEQQRPGIPVATKKDAGIIMKSLMAYAKMKSKNPTRHTKSKGKSRSGTKKGIMRDDKVHFAPGPKFY